MKKGQREMKFSTYGKQIIDDKKQIVAQCESEEIAVELTRIAARSRATKEETIEWLQEQRRRATLELLDFSAPINAIRCGKDDDGTAMFAALEHCDGAFEAAARFEIFTRALNALTDPKSKATVESLAEYALRETLNKTGPHKSSSMTARIMYIEVCDAWSRLYRFLTTRM